MLTACFNNTARAVHLEKRSSFELSGCWAEQNQAFKTTPKLVQLPVFREVLHKNLNGASSALGAAGPSVSEAKGQHPVAPHDSKRRSSLRPRASSSLVGETPRGFICKRAHLQRQKSPSELLRDDSPEQSYPQASAPAARSCAACAPGAIRTPRRPRPALGARYGLFQQGPSRFQPEQQASISCKNTV